MPVWLRLGVYLNQITSIRNFVLALKSGKALASLVVPTLTPLVLVIFLNNFSFSNISELILVLVLVN